MTEYDATHAMHVVHDGRPDAPPLLLVHGSGFSGASWARMVPALARHHHVIRVDLPGCGRSPAPPTYDVPDQARRVGAVLDRLGVRSVAVAGHSSGGYVATALAEQRPGLVRSLALISTGPDPAAFRRQPLLLRVLLTPPFGPLVWSRRSDDTVRAAITATTVRPVDVPDDLVADVRAVPYRAFRTLLRCNRAYVAERGIPDRLAGLGVPVLVVFGADDPRWESSSAHGYRAVPGARVEMLAGVGHVPLLEAPEATGDLVLGLTAAAWTRRR